MADANDPIAVVGGGIAGAAACLRLMALALDPVWIAPCPEKVDKPGEHLSPSARPLLSQVDAVHLLDRPQHRAANAMLSAWGADRIVERNAIVHLEGPGMVLDRMAFEADLVTEAVTRGVRRVDGTIETARKVDEVWHIFVGGEDLRTRFLIDASGRAAVVARALGRRFRADQLVALIAFAEQEPESDVTPTRATLVEAVPNGWWYASLLGDGRLALNYFTDPDLIPRGATRDRHMMETLLRDSMYVGRWVEEADFRLPGPPNLASAATTWLAPVAGPGWAAVGDAAAAFDPLSSHGMTTALWTALTAADAVPAALRGEDAGLKAYVTKVAAGVQEFLVTRVRVYGAEWRFRDQPFWRRRWPDGAKSQLSHPCVVPGIPIKGTPLDT